MEMMVLGLLQRTNFVTVLLLFNCILSYPEHLWNDEFKGDRLFNLL
jgi:hypothetical protein